MMKKLILSSLALLAVLASCGEKPNGGKTPSGGATAWSLPGPLVQKVEVRSGGTLLETYEYTYDDRGRLSSLRKTDKIQSAVFLDLQYSYPDETGMRATGKFYPVTSNRFITAVRNAADQTVSYAGSWSGAWSYATRYDAGGTALATATDLDFNATGGWYSAKTHLGEAYTVSGGCITRAEYGTEIEARTAQKTRSASAAQLTVSYTYSDREDKQNFAAYLFPCEFPVWVAAGLPGCKKLITGISKSAGSVSFPTTTQIAYTFTAEGNIDTATRTDLNDGAPVLVRTYQFYYQ